MEELKLKKLKPKKSLFNKNKLKKYLRKNKLKKFKLRKTLKVKKINLELDHIWEEWFHQ